MNNTPPDAARAVELFLFACGCITLVLSLGFVWAAWIFYTDDGFFSKRTSIRMTALSVCMMVFFWFEAAVLMGVYEY